MFGFFKKGRKADWQTRDDLPNVRVELPSEAVIRNALDDHPEVFLTAREVELIKSGVKVQAIKSYMDRTGASLKDSKDIIDAIERHLG